MQTNKPNVEYRTPPKMAFGMGIMAGITVASLVAFGLTFSVLQDTLDGTTTATNEPVGTVAGAEDTAPTPSPEPAPTAAPSADIVVTDDDHIKGNPDAPITIVEYSDFECPFCARHLPTIEQLASEYEGDVRIVFRHFPLSFHPEAQKAAEASECAAEQGKFWEMHDELFAMNEAGTLGIEQYKETAGELGLSQSQFDECLDSGKYAEAVQEDIESGSAHGVQGTPATFVNGQLVSGAVPFSNFQTIIDGLL